MYVLNVADFIIIGIIVISTLISLFRGFVREVLSLTTWVIAFIVAFKFCGKLAPIFTPYVDNQSLRMAIGFGILFLIILILGDLISYMIAKFASKKGLSGVDRTFGMIFGFIRGVLLVTVILLLASLGSSSHDSWYQQSYLIPHFQSMVNWLHGFLPAKLGGVSSVSHTATAIPGKVIPTE